MKRTPESSTLPGWERLRHGGLLFDGTRLQGLAEFRPEPLDQYTEGQVRQRATAILEGSGDTSSFVAFVLERICGLDASAGTWTRGTSVAPSWGRRAISGETVKPRHLWTGVRGASMPVFLDDGKRLGIGKGRRIVSQVLGWLRAGNEHLALMTNGRQWRLLFAGLDYDAWCEWDLELWFAEGELSPQVEALRTLLNAELWTPEAEGTAPRLLQAIRDTRRGQAELSEVLGERVREAVEILIRGHGEPLRALIEQPAIDHAEYRQFLADDAGVRLAEVPPDDEDPPTIAAPTPAEIYRASCRVAMRLVVILFAESRDLLPRDNTLYHGSYGLNGLLEQLDRDEGSLADGFGAWPRVLALFRLVREGSHHPDLPVTAYGGELFAADESDVTDGVAQALAVFEHACFENQVLSDRDVRDLLRLLTRTTVRIRQGRAGVRAVVPVDFSDLSSEYLGILYEGLLDYELKTAPPRDPVIFLSMGDQPALPLSRLQAMDDDALKALFESFKKNKPTEQDDVSEEDEEADETLLEPEEADAAAEGAGSQSDDRQRDRTRAETWARRAAQVAGLVRKRRGRQTPERRLADEQELAETARHLVARVVLPGEWYLVRWGGTRKGSGSFYTRPGLAIPTVHRTLRPLAYDPPTGADGTPDTTAPASRWTPKLPEKILNLTVCDPACGSGTFPLAALRFLTDALYASLQHHGRIEPDGERSLVRLLGIGDDGDQDAERIGDELIPCRPDDDDFEPRLKAILRRHVVERCIYAVDLDPLAVELCRLSLWIETMDRSLPFGFLDHKIKCGNSLIGAWFDQFQHYPVMAWKNREGGDKNHTNGVHFAKGARTKAIKAFVKDRLTPDLRQFLSGRDLFQEDLLEEAATAHDQALAVLAQIHALPMKDAVERARQYRDDVIGSAAWCSLKDAMDLWCACWFWPPDEIDGAPLPTTFAAPSVETRKVATRVATTLRFFHWELEFPDVYRDDSSGFDAIIGNPPWETIQPYSKEYFSNIDPMYRSYGRQHALTMQSRYFSDATVERDWLHYNSRSADFSNWMKHAGSPFGDPSNAQSPHDRFATARAINNETLHARWRAVRSRSTGYSDVTHPYVHQREGKAYTYKLFLEQSHALCAVGGRLGLIVPSGVHSDHGTGGLRDLFLERCTWEWLFGIENSQNIFPIHKSYKFNALIICKGGSTKTIRTAFMRRQLDDWENAETISTSYTLDQIRRLSPKTRAFLEIQSRRDLELLEKIYTNSVLLGHEGPGTWNIRYGNEFDMTNDSRLFPPRPDWEAKGYRPDEYSRWLLASWEPIEQLWDELDIDPSCPQSPSIALDKLLFDNTATLKRRNAEAIHLPGNRLKPGDVARTAWQLRCAQPPFDRLPIARGRLPAGIVLSREGDAFVREASIEDIALPFYEGRMIGQFDFSQKGWVTGKGRRAVWHEIPWTLKSIEPQYLMGKRDCLLRIRRRYGRKVAIMSITSSTNTRTMIASCVGDMPCGHSIGVLDCDSDVAAALGITLNSLTYDFALRIRFSGLNASRFVLEESPLPASQPQFREAANRLFARMDSPALARCTELTRSPTESPVRHALTPHERLRVRVILDVLVADAFGLDYDDVRHMLTQCDLPRTAVARQNGVGALNPKGFWRVDKDQDPEIRHTVLTLVAFRDLESKVEAVHGDRGKGVEAFLNQKEGHGWLLPETLRLADYGLGHDDRARNSQPVASRLGPRFYDWQLVQSPDDSWRECHLHARNLLGEQGYVSLLHELMGRRMSAGEDYREFLTQRFIRGLLGRDGYRQLLARLNARSSIDDYNPRGGTDPFADDADATLRVAESPAADTVQSPAEVEQGELFD